MSTDPMVPAVHHVERVTRETADTFTLQIKPADGSRPARFEPGQFHMLYVFGTGESAISISGDPRDNNSTVHTIRAVGTVTRGLHRLKRGETIGVRGPFGNSWPLAQAEGCDVVMVAGGIGLAPLRPAVYKILANRSRYGRVVLLYGARSPRDLIYREELERWRDRIDVEVTLDSATSEWHGNVGVVTNLIPNAPFNGRDSVAMICGPEVMMRFTIQEFRKRGVSDDRIYVSMERNMTCAVGSCGHCQYGPHFVCKDGPVFRFDRIAGLLRVREI